MSQWIEEQEPQDVPVASVWTRDQRRKRLSHRAQRDQPSRKRPEYQNPNRKEGWGREATRRAPQVTK